MIRFAFHLDVPTHQPDNLLYIEKPETIPSDFIAVPGSHPIKFIEYERNIFLVYPPAIVGYCIIRKTKRATLSERNVPKLKRNDSPSQNEMYL